MSKQDFVKLLKKPKPVFANVRLTQTDCWYVQLVKSNLLLVIAEHSDETVYDVGEREDAIYID